MGEVSLVMDGCTVMLFLFDLIDFTLMRKYERMGDVLEERAKKSRDRCCQVMMLFFGFIGFDFDVRAQSESRKLCV